MKKLFKVIILILAIVGVLGIAEAAYVFYIIRNVDYKYTGEELFAAVNEHRERVGVQTLELDPLLCDNLVERWLAINEPNSGHKGFEEWVIAEGLGNEAGETLHHKIIGELYIKTSTPDNAIHWWLGSPGHKSTLEMPELDRGCAYASEGVGVVIVGQSL